MNGDRLKRRGGKKKKRRKRRKRREKEGKGRKGKKKEEKKKRNRGRESKSVKIPGSAPRARPRADLSARSRPCFCVIASKISKQLSSPQPARLLCPYPSALSRCLARGVERVVRRRGCFAFIPSPVALARARARASLPTILKKIGRNLKRPLGRSPRAGFNPAGREEGAVSRARRVARDALPLSAGAYRV